MKFISLHVFGLEGRTCFQEQSQTIGRKVNPVQPGLLQFDNQFKIALDAISDRMVLKKVPNIGY